MKTMHVYLYAQDADDGWLVNGGCTALLLSLYCQCS
jgi:hypothetical protein